MLPHQQDTAALLRDLNTDAHRGLSSSDAAERLATHGPNELIDRGAKSPWAILWEQFTGTMVIVLLVAAGVSAFMQDYKDVAAIMVIVLINAILGFTQEFRAERAMAALKKLAVPFVRVRRDGTVREIPASQLVPGDIVIVESGNRVPADCRVLESVNMRVQEAALTGESEPVEKISFALEGESLAIGDRRNMMYLGTVVTYGRGTAVVTGTGMATELGTIATLIQDVGGEPTPLQRKLDKLGKALVYTALAIVVVIFALGIFRGEAWDVMFLTAVSMAVAAIPEGLPAVVTIALALGAQRMLKRRALIRKLPAVESLGAVTVICSDKTGTLTENRMTVTMLDIAGHSIDLVEQVREGTPVLAEGAFRTMVATHDGTVLMLTSAALCNDAVLLRSEAKEDLIPTVGDPTEGALLVAAARYSLDKAELDQAFPRVAEAPFDAVRKRMTTVHALPDSAHLASPALARITELLASLGAQGYVAFTKGAVDGLLDISTQVWDESRVRPMDAEARARIADANAVQAMKGMRVLGVAMRPLDAAPATAEAHNAERDLIFVGLISMIDPARPEVRDAVRTCTEAGIRTIMITGDHPLTAQHIARELGITQTTGCITGVELERMSDEEIDRAITDVNVFARVSPEHKLRIVYALQKKGEIVAMTGDGVNDAPALKKADIGVAMGITGTDVSKEAADMILLDDNFATIVAAVEEGRVIYDNIRKFLKYMLTSNSGELWIMLVAPLLGMPLALLPIQILWINLVTDGLPALALGIEPGERFIMRRPPYPPQEHMFGRGLGRHVIIIGFLMGFVPLVTGYIMWRNGDPNWQPMLFTIITLAQMGHALAVRSERYSLFAIGLRSNLPLLGAVALTFVLQLGIIYVPFAHDVFHTVSMPIEDLLLAIVLSSVVFWAVELEKQRFRKHIAG